jgi:hypothetical protein
MKTTSSLRHIPCLFFAFLSALSTELAAAAPATFKVGEFTFTRPPAWEWVEIASSMRKAQLRVPDPKSKESAEIDFFEGIGGGTKANVERWLSAFQEPRDKINAKIDEITVGGRKITYVQAEGTYLSGMPGGAKTPLANHALLGGIIENPSGDVFIRMTGPVALVKTTTAEFKKFIDSAVKGK